MSIYKTIPTQLNSLKWAIFTLVWLLVTQSVCQSDWAWLNCGKGESEKHYANDPDISGFIIQFFIFSCVKDPSGQWTLFQKILRVNLSGSLGGWPVGLMGQNGFTGTTESLLGKMANQLDVTTYPVKLKWKWLDWAVMRALPIHTVRRPLRAHWGTTGHALPQTL